MKQNSKALTKTVKVKSLSEFLDLMEAGNIEVSQPGGGWYDSCHNFDLFEIRDILAEIEAGSMTYQKQLQPLTLEELVRACADNVELVYWSRCQEKLKASDVTKQSTACYIVNSHGICKYYRKQDTE